MLTGSHVFLVERGYNADTDVDHQMTSDVNKCRDVTKRNASLHIYIYGTPTCNDQYQHFGKHYNVMNM